MRPWGFWKVLGYWMEGWFKSSKPSTFRFYFISVNKAITYMFYIHTHVYIYMGVFFTQNEIFWDLSSTHRESERSSGCRPFDDIRQPRFSVGLSHCRPLLATRMVFNHFTASHCFYPLLYIVSFVPFTSIALKTGSKKNMDIYLFLYLDFWVFLIEITLI